MKEAKTWLAILIVAAGIGQAAAGQEGGSSSDWANLAAYRFANATLGQPTRDERRIVFIGDSITAHWNKAAPGFFRDPSHINRGISGQTTSQMLVRFRSDVIALDPSVVVILGGTNDIAGNSAATSLEVTEGNIASMAELARSHGIRVVLASVLPATGYWWSPGVEPAARIVELNRWIGEYARRNGFVYLDYHSAMVDNNGGLRRAYSDDGVHPNAAGYEVMAPLAEKAIAAALSAP